MRGVGEAERWVHLGVRHGVTNLLLHKEGRSQVHLRAENGLTNGTTTSFPPPLPSTSSAPSSPPPSPELFSCTLCAKRTKSQCLLHTHLVAVHYKAQLLRLYGNPSNSCTICRKTLPNSDALAFHMGQEHGKLQELMEEAPEDADNSVEDDAEEVVDDKEEEQVEEMEEVVEQLTCFKCGRQGKDKAALYGHYSLHHFSQELMGEHGVQSVCPVRDCGQTVDPGTAWIEHIGEAHSGVEKYLPAEHHLPSPPLLPPAPHLLSPLPLLPTTPLSCPLSCPDVFTTELQLTEHFRNHHGFSQEVVQKMKMKKYSLKTSVT